MGRFAKLVTIAAGVMVSDTLLGLGRCLVTVSAGVFSRLRGYRDAIEALARMGRRSRPGRNDHQDHGENGADSQHLAGPYQEFPY